MTEPLILGRQPDVIYITPSKPNPWYGSIIEGERFTREQLRVLASRILDPQAVRTVIAKRNATDREMYWATGEIPPQYHFACPVVGTRMDGKLYVIAPDGQRKLINADGWVGAPGKPKRSMW